MKTALISKDLVEVRHHAFKAEFQAFLQQFRKEAAHHGHPLAQTLADSLQNLFAPAQIVVVVARGGGGRVRGARSRDAGETERLSADEAKEALLNLVPSDFSISRTPRFSRGVGGSEGHYIICLSAPSQSGRPWEAESLSADFFWIFLSGVDEEQDRENVEGLRRNSEELGDLYDHLQATLNIARVPEFHLAVERLRQSRETLLSERLRDATKLAREIQPYIHPSTFLSILRGCEALGRWAVQEVVGTGWSYSLGDGAAHRNNVRVLFSELKSVASMVGPAGEKLAEAHPNYNPNFEAYELIACDQEGWASSEHLDLGEALTDPLSLLGRWTRLHRICSELSHPARELHRGYDIAWLQSVGLTLGPLTKLLAEGWDEDAEPREKRDGLPRELRGFAAWLAGWLVTEMLKMMVQEPGREGGLEPSRLEMHLTPSERWRLRSQVSLLVRETFRQVEFGNLPDFNFDPGRYLQALAEVVEHHAHFVVGVPREIDLRDLLKTIGEARDADDGPFAASHLQHALQVYIAGHFLAGLVIRGDSESSAFGDAGTRSWTFLEALTDRTLQGPGELTLKEALQAFSLAALFHDTGMLLFPRVSFPAKELPRGDRLLKLRLRKIHAEVDSAARELMADCEKELLDEDYFDPQQERPLAVWLQDARDSGRLDHSLLGACYLHRIADGNRELSSEVVRQAVRAVLLHQVVTQQVDSEQDPVAVLLILCDELMDWRPSGHHAGGLLVGLPPFGRRELDVRPEGSRARRIRIQNLLQEGGCWTIARNGERGWPQIEVLLREPDHLVMPVYQTWLLMLENLSRLSPRPTVGWYPEVTVVSTVPGQLSTVNTNHKLVLSMLARVTRLPCRTHLEKWLKRIADENVPGKERFRIDPSKGDPWRESILQSFEELGEEFDNALREIEREAPARRQR